MKLVKNKASRRSVGGLYSLKRGRNCWCGNFYMLQSLLLGEEIFDKQSTEDAHNAIMASLSVNI